MRFLQSLTWMVEVMEGRAAAYGIYRVGAKRQRMRIPTDAKPISTDQCREVMIQSDSRSSIGRGAACQVENTA